MNTDYPKISIVTITKNRVDFIAKAIESARNQTFIDWELLILDDDSNDQTKAIVENFIVKDDRIKYYKNSPALGISKNRNLGLSLSKGKYIAMLDSDDMWIDKEKLQKQFDVLEKNNEIGIIGSSIICVNEKGQKIKDFFYETEDNKIRNKILVRNQFAQSSVMFRKSIFNEIEGYNEKLNVAEDLDLWLKIGLKYMFANLEEQTTTYTIHNKGISKEKKLEMATTVDKIIDENKNNYPNYFLAKIVSILRIIRVRI